MIAKEGNTYTTHPGHCSAEVVSHADPNASRVIITLVGQDEGLYDM